ncbi:hypothetical protein FXO38_13424 [Capsicum annuum]|nr:hypothetical protein FXO38_13424 [Capsicum annuum]
MFKSLYWSIRSINSNGALQRLKRLIKSKNLPIIALATAFHKDNRLDKYKRILGNQFAYSNCNSQIWLFWDSNMDCIISEEDDKQAILVLLLHGVMVGSDRCPLLITANNSHKTPVRYFRFLDFWTDEPDFLNIVEQTWNIEVEGEVNSKFFHSIVKGRKKRLNLTSIHDEHNNWISGDDNIAQQAIKFFEKQFTKEDIPLDDTVMNCIPKIINDEDNTLLLALPSMDEMKDVIFSMSAYSAPEPDGFSGDLPSLNLMLSKLDTYEKISGKMINRRKSAKEISHFGGITGLAKNYEIYSNNLAEVKAILQGIKICISMRLSNVIIEDDSQIIIDMINNKMKPPRQIYYIIDNIIQLSSKVNFIFVHTYREGNKLADLLANYGESIPDNIIMNSVNRLPDSVKAFLNLEKLGIPNFRFKTKSDHFFINGA